MKNVKSGCELSQLENGIEIECRLDNGKTITGITGNQIFRSTAGEIYIRRGDAFINEESNHFEKNTPCGIDQHAEICELQIDPKKGILRWENPNTRRFKEFNIGPTREEVLAECQEQINKGL